MERIKKISTKELVLQDIRKAIFEGVMSKGQEITQEGIAGLLGVSRMPVREAFEILAREGLIKIDANRRVTVIGLTMDDIHDHYEIRSLLEGLAVQKAMQNNMDIHVLTEIQKKIKKAADTRDSVRYVQLNELFHSHIWKASGSPRLQGILSDLWNGLQPQFPEFVDGQIEKSFKEHERICKAMLDGESELARKRLEEHILRSKESFLFHYEKNQGSHIKGDNNP